MAQIKILVIEDKEIFVAQIQPCLSELGYPAPILVSSGEEAVQAAAEVQPDLILMGSLPQEKPDEVTALTQRLQQRCDVPVIYLLDRLDKQIINPAKITQPADYILKPLEIREAHLVIESALHHHQLKKKLKESEQRLTTVLAEHQQTEAAEREQRLLAEALGRVGLALNATLELPDLLDLICQESMTLFKVKGAYVWLVQGDELVGFASHGLGREKFIGLRVPLADSHTLGPVITREKRPIFVNNAANSDQINQHFRQLMHIKALLGVPLIKADKAIGALMISDTDHAHRFGPDDIKIATVLGNYAAIAIENAYLLETEREQRELAEALREIGAVLNATLDFNAVLDRLLDQIARVALYDTGNVFWVEAGHAHAVRTRGHEQFGSDVASAAASLSFDLAKTPNMRQMVETRQPLIISDTASEPTWLKGEPWAHVRSWAGAPILAQGQVIAFFSLDKIEPGFYQAKHGERLAVFAGQAGLALENARLYTQTRRRLEEQNALRQAGAMISSTLELDVVLRRIAEQMGQIVDATSAYICYLEPETMSATLLAEYFSPAAQSREIVSELGITYNLPLDFPQISATLQAGQPGLFHLNDPDLLESMQAYMQRYGVQTMLDIPLQVGGQVVAYAELWDSRQRDFTPEEIALCQDIAQQAAVTIQNAQLFNKIRRQAQQLAILNELAGKMTGLLEVRELCAIVAECIYSTFGYYNVAVFTVDLPGQQLVLQVNAGAYAGKIEPGEYHQAFGAGIIGQAAEKGEIVVVNDTRKHPHFFELEGMNIRSELAIPLKIGKQVVGVLNLDSDRFNTFDESDVAALTTVADQLAVAIEKARLFDETCQWAEQLEALRQVSQDLIALRDLDTLLRQIAERAIQLLDGDGGSIYLYRPERQVLELMVAIGEKMGPVGATLKPGEGISGRIWVRREPLIVNDYQQWPDKAPRWANFPAVAVLGVPIQWGDEALGVLNLHTYNSRHRFTSEDANLLKHFATQAAIAIQNARLYQAERARYHEAEAMRRAALALTSTISMAQVLKRILTELQRVVPYDSASVQLLKENRLEIIGGHGFPNLTELLGISFPIQGNNPNTLVIKSKEPVIIHDVTQTYPAFSQKPHAEANIHAWLGIPLFINDQAIGMLALDKQIPNFYTEAHARAAMTYAAQAAIAIENARLYEQVQHHATELEMRVAERTFELQVLYELTQALGQATQLGDVIRLILLHLYQAIPYDVAASLLVTDSVGTLVIQSQRPVSANIESHIQEIMSVVLKQRLANEALDVRRIQSRTEAITRAPLEDLASMMQVPIVIDQDPVGLLLVAAEQPAQFNQEQLHLLHTIADQAAESIQRLQLLLAAEHQRLESLVAHLPDGVVLLDADQYIVLANPVAQKFLALLTPAETGDKLTQLGGQPLQVILTPEATGSPQEIELPSYPRQVFEVTAKPMAVGPEAGGWTLMIRDVTEERAAQERNQQQDRLVAVGQLAAGIAHDFNNILTSMIGYAELARIHPNIPHTIGEDLQRIIQQGQRAARLVRQILDFSRQSIVEKSPLDLAVFLTETVKLLERTIPENIRITLEIEPDNYEAYILNADPTQLTHVLTNLAVNARDAMPAGGILHVRLSSLVLNPGERPPYPEMSPGYWLELSISDTGAGIAPEVLPHIFDPFFTTKEVGKGTGLGLAQVYGIITQHDGYIDVQTQPEQGTTFLLYLPTVMPLSKTPAPSIEAETTRGQGEVILLVEDDPDVLEVTQAMLEHLGYRVVIATNGRHALEVYEQYQAEIALVLTDVTMPEMGGVALSQSLQEKYPAIKVVALTGYPLEEESKDLLAQGIVGWLQKPLNRRQLGQTISRSLKLEAKSMVGSDG